jgi:hypothetical protein
LVYVGVYRRGAIDRVGGYDETYQRAETGSLTTGSAWPRE